MLETARGLEHAFEIATASPRVKALTLGGQDLTADLGCRRPGRVGTLLRPGRVVMAARAAGIAAFDTVWTDVDDPDGLAAEAKQIVEMGFHRKGRDSPQPDSGHPRGVPPDPGIQEGLAHRHRRGRGGAAGQGRSARGRQNGGRPIVVRAQRLLDLGVLYGMKGDETA
jgi:citrate lyase subunit beta/citryl-CoA lyase